MKRTLAALGVSPRSYYCWLKAHPSPRPDSESPTTLLVELYEALPKEKKGVFDYARKHADLRHSEMAWKMVDEDVAYLSPSTVYRILKAMNLVCPWQRRTKRLKAQPERAMAPDQR